MDKSFEIIVDSTVCLPDHLKTSYNIYTIPQTLVIDDNSLLDNIDIKKDRFYTFLSNGNYLPKTSQATPNQFIEMIQHLGRNTRNFIIVVLSSELSGTYNSAVLAKKNLPEFNIKIIDSGTIASATGLCVLGIARARESGISFDETSFIGHDLANKVNFIFTLDNTKYLIHGGRLGQYSSNLPSLVSTKYIFSIVNGKIIPIDRSRTRKKADELMVKHFLGSMGTNKKANIAISHVDATLRVKKLIEMLRSLSNQHNIIESECSPVIAAHSGLGAIGMAWNID